MVSAALAVRRPGAAAGTPAPNSTEAAQGRPGTFLAITIRWISGSPLTDRRHARVAIIPLDRVYSRENAVAAEIWQARAQTAFACLRRRKSA